LPEASFVIDVPYKEAVALWYCFKQPLWEKIYLLQSRMQQK